MKKSRSNTMRDFLLYGGLTREEYRQIGGEIHNGNRKGLLVFSSVASVFLIVMYALSFASQSISQNRYLYLGAALVIGAVFMAVRFLSGRHPRVLSICIYVFLSVLYIFGIALGTISNTDRLTVTFIAGLLTAPLLFTDYPVRMAACTGVFVLAFIPVVCLTKTGYVRSIDIINVVIFGAMSMIISTYMMHFKCQRILYEQRALMLSRTDVLTGLNNRNFFERSLPDYPSRCARSLSCVYVDVDGLHELNNTRGHAAGDRMLQFVAERMKDQFALEHTYRIGGDEFVAFVPDCPDGALPRRLDDLRKAVEAEGYHISVGCQTQDRDAIDMTGIIRDAETAMYAAKKRHYEEKATVRVNRSALEEHS